MDNGMNQTMHYTDPRGRLVRPLDDHFYGPQGCDGSGMEGEFIYDGHDGQGRLLHSCNRCGFLTDGFSKRARNALLSIDHRTELPTAIGQPCPC